jgi:hypothetical protein
LRVDPTEPHETHVASLETFAQRGFYEQIDPLSSVAIASTNHDYVFRLGAPGNTRSISKSLELILAAWSWRLVHALRLYDRNASRIGSHLSERICNYFGGENQLVRMTNDCECVFFEAGIANEMWHFVNKSDRSDARFAEWFDKSAGSDRVHNSQANAGS